jgi:uncharacterized protein
MHIYLHGFASSPESAKAKMLGQWFADRGRGADFASPPLPISPAEVMRMFVESIHLQPGDTLIGSSLGGFYATVLAERYGCSAVLLNPVVHAARDLATKVGTNLGYHDGQKFDFTVRHVDELRALEMGAISFPDRYFLVAAKGDEVLRWQDMVNFYSGAKKKVLEGSDHGLSDFAEYIDEVAQFSRTSSSRTSPTAN